MTSTALSLGQLLHQVTSRYRAALLVKGLIRCGLSLGVLGAIVWRLRDLSINSLWGVWVPGALACLTVLILVWWLRRQWMSDRESAVYLDRTLKLEQRLVTASEFARAPQVSPLYPLLVEDAVQRVALKETRFPRPLDRYSGSLALLLLLLLIWPYQGRGFMRLVKLPQPTHPPQPSPPHVPPLLKQDQSREQGSSSGERAPSSESGTSKEDGDAGEGGRGTGEQSSASGQHGMTPQGNGQTGVGREDPFPPSAHDGQAQQQQSAGSAKGGFSPQADQSLADAHGGSDQQASPNAQQPGTDAQGAEGKEQRIQDGLESTTSPSRPSQEAGRDHQRSAASTQHAPERQSQTPGRSAPSSQPQAANTQGQGGKEQAAQGGARSSSERQSSTSRDESSVASAEPAGAGSQQSLGNQEALKAEIQALLKEVSGALKQLQAQLASAQPHQPLEPGTSADPNLYESPETAEHQTGTTLPIQLQTDHAPIQTQRPGSGVGRPSEDVSHAAPHAKAEDAQLADEPLEEPSASRKTIPPEYRSAFERLHRAQPDTQKETP